MNAKTKQGLLAGVLGWAVVAPGAGAQAPPAGSAPPVAAQCPSAPSDKACTPQSLDALKAGDCHASDQCGDSKLTCTRAADLLGKVASCQDRLRECALMDSTAWRLAQKVGEDSQACREKRDLCDEEKALKGNPKRPGF